MEAHEIKVGRGLAGIKTQQELADLLGVDKKTVNNWENGRHKPGAFAEARMKEIFNERAPRRAPVNDPQAQLAAFSDADLIRALTARLALLRSLIPEDARMSTGNPDADALLGMIQRQADPSQ